MRRTRRTRGQKEGQTGRPERGTRGCHGYRRIPASPRCHGDGGTLSLSLSSPLFSFSGFLYLAHSQCRPTRSHSRNFVLLALVRQSSLRRRRATCSLALASSFAEGIAAPTERGKSKEEHAKETARGRVHMRDTWSSTTSKLNASPEQFDHLSNASHSQPRNALARDAYLWRSRGS